MNKINSTIVGRQSSMDDIRGYFNRVYNQMKEDPCLRRAKFSQQHRTKSVTHESAKLISRQS